MEHNNNQSSLDKELLIEEKKIEQEIKKENKLLQKLNRKMIIAIGMIGGLILAVGIAAYIIIANNKIYTDQAEISAPVIDLAPEQSGTLDEVFVRQGDEIDANTPVARVGNELIKSKVAGVVINVKRDLGKIFNRGEAVVSMIEPRELRVIGRIEEDKGLKDVKIGQRVKFTVDAYGGREYWGIVDEISQTSRSSDIVFSISDKREAKKFNVFVRFNTDNYSELKNGMSAKIWIYKN